MVSRDDDIVTDLVHDVDDIRALGQCPQDAALKRVAVVDERHVVGCLFHLRPVSREAGVTDVVVHGAMDVVCIQDDDVLAAVGKRGDTE